MLRDLIKKWGVGTPSNQTKKSLKTTQRKVQESINVLESREREIVAAIKRQQSDLDYVLNEKRKLIEQKTTIENLIK